MYIPIILPTILFILSAAALMGSLACYVYDNINSEITIENVDRENFLITTYIFMGCCFLIDCLNLIY